MRRLVVALALAAAIGAALLRAPRAEPGAPSGTGLSAAEISATLRATGFEPLHRPLRRQGVYAVRAVDRSRRNVDLTVDAATGRIVTARRAPHVVERAGGPPRPYIKGPPGSGLDDTAGFEDSTGALPVPPGMIPGRRTGTSRPAAVLPIPRARPSQPTSAAAEAVSVAAPTRLALPPPPRPGRPEIPPAAPLE